MLHGARHGSKYALIKNGRAGIERAGYIVLGRKTTTKLAQGCTFSRVF